MRALNVFSISLVVGPTRRLSGRYTVRSIRADIAVRVSSYSDIEA